jgi:hypothetical protein
MTFDEYWANLKNKPIPQLKPDFAACWNAALEELLSPHLLVNLSDLGKDTTLKNEIFQRVHHAYVDRIQSRRVKP